MKRLCVVLLVGLMANAPALAWGPGGHMIVAFIAYQRLNPTAKKAVDALIARKINPAVVSAASLDFVNASHWPDDLRDAAFKTEFAFSFPLHFADFPFSPDHTPLPADLPAKQNILTALPHYVDVLKTSKDEDARAQALRFVIHFVGDIQQPLHLSAEVTHALPRGDQGGNLFEILLSNGRGAPTKEKLHSYWDGGIGDFPKGGPPPKFEPPPLTEIPPAVERLLPEAPDTNPLWKAGGPSAFDGWAKESSHLAETVAYVGIEPNQMPSAAYNTAALKVVHQRAVWGGYRLAALLNTVWPEPPTGGSKGKTDTKSKGK